MKIISTLVIACLSFVGLSYGQSKKDSVNRSLNVKGVVDLSHSFSFYGDGRFGTQYLPTHKMVTNWGNLYDFPLKNANLLILLDCDPHLKYIDKDIDAIDKFMQGGGAVLLMGTQGKSPQNDLAEHYGAPFTKGAVPPISPTEELSVMYGVEGNGHSVMELKEPKDWTILIKDSEDKPLLAQRKVGRGTLIVSSRSLAGSSPDASDKINSEWWGKLLEKATAFKKISDSKELESRGLQSQGNKKKVGTLLYHYSDYLAPYLDAMVKLDTKLRPMIEKRMGVPLSKGMAGEVGLLATDGGGFSSGKCVGLAVFWGGFPEKEDSMIEFITHESVHSWVLPYPEVSNEPIATYIGNLVMQDAGYEEEGQRRINETIGRARAHDDTMKRYNLNGESDNPNDPVLTKDQANDIHWGKSYWIWEEMRKKDPEFQAKYFQAKRKYVSGVDRYTLSDTVAVMSFALNEDLFPWFNEHGMQVDRKNVKVKAPTPKPAKK